ncbi:MAG: FAD-dependent oxidoreductase [Bacteroidetes bacterium]|nr:FAD-dependent oxidoreductase [Bacteroidota bacterium]
MNTDFKITSGSNLSFWTEVTEPIKFDQLKNDLSCNAVVIGGGIAGLTIAYELIENNQSVILIEDGYIGSGESGRTTAHLTYVLDERYYSLIKSYGREKAKLIAESHINAISKIESIVNKENISCDFMRLDGYLFPHPSDDIDTIEKEFKAASELGLPVSIVNDIPGMKINSIQALKFSQQAQFHPMKYLKGLSDAIQQKGGKIFTSTHASEISSKGIVTESGKIITADNVVIATNSPVNNKIVMHLKQFAYRAYVISALVPKNSIVPQIWWDTGDNKKRDYRPPYHFARMQNYNDTHDVLICGGEDHPTGQADAEGKPEEERYSDLIKWCKDNFEIGEIINKWSGQILYSMDGLAYIGRNPGDADNIFITTGDSGNGMTYANIAADLISDLIQKKENNYEKIYSPSRFDLINAGSVFIKEIVGGFVSYLKNKSSSDDVQSTLELKPTEGHVVNYEGSKFGVYKDEHSKLHIVNPKCTHLGCTVNWNNDEKSWDCPCHGSRFDIFGKVLNGPANTPLEYFDEDPTENTNTKISEINK